MPEKFLEIMRYFALTSYCNAIGQSHSAFPLLGFSLAGKRRERNLFTHWLTKQITNTSRNHFSRSYESRSIRVFFGWKTKRSCFDLFISWLIKQITNTLIRKPFFKVIRKSLLRSRKRDESLALCKDILDNVGFWIPHQVVDSGFFVSGTCMIRIPIVSGIRIIARAVFRIQSPRFQIPQAKSLNSGYPNSEVTPFHSSYDTKFSLCKVFLTFITTLFASIKFREE